jgi:hypothetical protein
MAVRSLHNLDQAARSGAPLIRDPPKARFVAVPGLQRIIALRFMLRCARDTRLVLGAYGVKPAGDDKSVHNFVITYS